MTQFALTRSWFLASRRHLVVSEVEGGPVVSVPTMNPSRPLTVWVADIVACVVLRAPSAPGPLGIRLPRDRHPEFESVLPDGTALASVPVVADLTTGGPATLALVIDPPQPVSVPDGGHRRDLVADVILCSPEEPDALARALGALGVTVDTDVNATAIRSFGTTHGAPLPNRAGTRTRSRWTAWAVAACVVGGIILRETDASQLAAIPYGIAFVVFLVELTSRRRV